MTFQVKLNVKYVISNAWLVLLNRIYALVAEVIELELIASAPKAHSMMENQKNAFLVRSNVIRVNLLSINALLV